jgi:hypothetical protein
VIWGFVVQSSQIWKPVSKKVQPPNQNVNTPSRPNASAKLAILENARFFVAI